MCFYHKNPYHSPGCRRTLMGQQGSLVCGIKLLSYSFRFAVENSIPDFFFVSESLTENNHHSSSITSKIPQSVQGALKENVLNEKEKVHHGTARDSSLSKLFFFSTMS